MLRFRNENAARGRKQLSTGKWELGDRFTINLDDHLEEADEVVLHRHGIFPLFQQFRGGAIKHPRVDDPTVTGSFVYAVRAAMHTPGAIPGYVAGDPVYPPHYIELEDKLTKLLNDIKEMKTITNEAQMIRFVETYFDREAFCDELIRTLAAMLNVITEDPHEQKRKVFQELGRRGFPWLVQQFYTRKWTQKNVTKNVVDAASIYETFDVSTSEYDWNYIRAKAAFEKHADDTDLIDVRGTIDVTYRSSRSEHESQVNIVPGGSANVPFVLSRRRGEHNVGPDTTTLSSELGKRKATEEHKSQLDDPDPDSEAEADDDDEEEGEGEEETKAETAEQILERVFKETVRSELGDVPDQKIQEMLEHYRPHIEGYIQETSKRDMRVFSLVYTNLRFLNECIVGVLGEEKVINLYSSKEEKEKEDDTRKRPVEEKDSGENPLKRARPSAEVEAESEEEKVEVEVGTESDSDSEEDTDADADADAVESSGESELESNVDVEMLFDLQMDVTELLNDAFRDMFESTPLIQESPEVVTEAVFNVDTAPNTPLTWLLMVFRWWGEYNAEVPIAPLLSYLLAFEMSLALNKDRVDVARLIISLDRMPPHREAHQSLAQYILAAASTNKKSDDLVRFVRSALYKHLFATFGEQVSNMDSGIVNAALSRLSGATFQDFNISLSALWSQYFTTMPHMAVSEKYKDMPFIYYLLQVLNMLDLNAPPLPSHDSTKQVADIRGTSVDDFAEALNTHGVYPVLRALRQIPVPNPKFIAFVRFLCELEDVQPDMLDAYKEVLEQFADVPSDDDRFAIAKQKGGETLEDLLWRDAYYIYYKSSEYKQGGGATNVYLNLVFDFVFEYGKFREQYIDDQLTDEEIRNIIQKGIDETVRRVIFNEHLSDEHQTQEFVDLLGERITHAHLLNQIYGYMMSAVTLIDMDRRHMRPNLIDSSGQGVVPFCRAGITDGYVRNLATALRPLASYDPGNVDARYAKLEANAQNQDARRMDMTSTADHLQNIYDEFPERTNDELALIDMFKQLSFACVEVDPVSYYYAQVLEQLHLIMNPGGDVETAELPIDVFRALDLLDWIKEGSVLDRYADSSAVSDQIERLTTALERMDWAVVRRCFNTIVGEIYYGWYKTHIQTTRLCGCRDHADVNPYAALYIAVAATQSNLADYIVAKFHSENTDVDVLETLEEKLATRRRISKLVGLYTLLQFMEHEPIPDYFFVSVVARDADIREMFNLDQFDVAHDDTRDRVFRYLVDVRPLNAQQQAMRALDDRAQELKEQDEAKEEVYRADPGVLLMNVIEASKELGKNNPKLRFVKDLLIRDLYNEYVHADQYHFNHDQYSNFRQIVNRDHGIEYTPVSPRSVVPTYVDALYRIEHIFHSVLKHSSWSEAYKRFIPGVIANEVEIIEQEIDVDETNEVVVVQVQKRRRRKAKAGSKTKIDKVTISYMDDIIRYYFGVLVGLVLMLPLINEPSNKSKVAETLDLWIMFIDNFSLGGYMHEHGRDNETLIDVNELYARPPDHAKPFTDEFYINTSISQMLWRGKPMHRKVMEFIEVAIIDRRHKRIREHPHVSLLRHFYDQATLPAKIICLDDQRNNVDDTSLALLRPIGVSEDILQHVVLHSRCVKTGGHALRAIGMTLALQTMADYNLYMEAMADTMRYFGHVALMVAHEDKHTGKITTETNASEVMPKFIEIKYDGVGDYAEAMWKGRLNLFHASSYPNLTKKQFGNKIWYYFIEEFGIKFRRIVIIHPSNMIVSRPYPKTEQEEADELNLDYDLVLFQSNDNERVYFFVADQTGDRNIEIATILGQAVAQHLEQTQSV